MITVNVRVDNRIADDIKRKQAQLQALPQQALDEFVDLTPRRSGNARRNTRLRNRDTISANYPYAQRLDEGYSNQAPQGMTRPWERWLANRLRQIFGK